MKLERYTRSTVITNFYPVPRSLINGKLPAAAVIIYAMLLDRATLSQKNDYTDISGWIYVVYAQEELAQQLDISTRMVRRHIQALSGAGLIRPFRSSRKNANRYYLMIPGDCMTGTGTGHPCPSHRTNPAHMTGHRLPPNNRKEQQDINDLYQHAEGESL